MPRTRRPYGTYRYTPTVGVRTDLKRLMNTFLSHNTVRYEVFSEVWRAKNMTFLFACRGSDPEAREFMERVLVIAQEYFLPPFQFQVRVGGLYLLYALFQIQPLVPKVKIRMTRSQWQDTLFLQQQAALQSHLDVVYIFNRLLCEHAFQFVFFLEEMNIPRGAQDIQDNEESLADGLREEKSCVNSLFNYESMEQLSYLQDQYRQMKIGLSGPEATTPKKSLDVVQEDLVEDLILMLQSFRNKVSSIYKYGKRNEEKKEPEKKVKTTGSRRMAIKAQAYSQVTSKRARNTHIVIMDDQAQHGETSPQKSAPEDTDLEDSREQISVPKKKGKSFNMPMVEGDNDWSSDDDPEDEDYEPPSKQMKTKNATKGPAHKMKNKKCTRNRISTKLQPPQSDSDGEMNQSETPPKRKRGRPPKYSVPPKGDIDAFRKFCREKLNCEPPSDICEIDLIPSSSKLPTNKSSVCTKRRSPRKSPEHKIRVKSCHLFKSITLGPYKSGDGTKKVSQFAPEEPDSSDDEEVSDEASNDGEVVEGGLNFAQAVGNLMKIAKKKQGANSSKPTEVVHRVMGKAKTEELMTADLPTTTHIIVKGHHGKSPLDLSAIARAVKSKDAVSTSAPGSAVHTVKVKILQQKDLGNNSAPSKPAQPKKPGNTVKKKREIRNEESGFDILFDDDVFPSNYSHDAKHLLNLSDDPSENDEETNWDSPNFVKPVGIGRKWRNHYKLRRVDDEVSEVPEMEDVKMGGGSGRREPDTSDMEESQGPADSGKSKKPVSKKIILPKGMQFKFL